MLRYNGGNAFRQYLADLGIPNRYYQDGCVNTPTVDGYCSEYSIWEPHSNPHGAYYWIDNDHQPHAYRWLLRGSRNFAGRLANFDPNRIEEVAFGIQDFEVEENDSTMTLKMTERPDRRLWLVDAVTGASFGSTLAADPSSIVIPASGDQARTITVLSQPVPSEGTRSATFAESSLVIDSSQAVTVDFEIEEK
jgi:hypothetical protein